MVKIDKILVPVDFSSCSKAALEYAIHFGNCLKASKIDVLHVWKPPKYIALDHKLRGAEGQEQSLAEFAKSQVGKEMKTFLAEIESGGDFDVHGRLESGVPYQTVLEVAEAEGYDLIIMGTHGEAAAQKLGSIATKVVRNACCPVLTIRAGE
jgi:nucleotide-binding universal stress UspA family protein